MFNFSKTMSWLQSGEMEKEDQENPEWLTPALGEDSLLSQSQVDFIRGIGSRIARKVQCMPLQASEARAREIKRIAASMRNDFSEVVEKLKRNSSSKQCFREKYPEWREFREGNIQNLRKIADKIDTHRENCQVSKALGSLVSLIGGGICLAAGDDERNRTSQTIGSAMMGLGTLASAGTSAIEELLLRENIEKVREIMQVDKEHMRYLVEWLDDATCLKEAMDRIQSITRKDFLDAADGFQDIFQKSLGKSEKELEIQKILNSLNVSRELRKEASEIIGILMTVTMLFDRYRPVFSLAAKGYQVMSKLRLAADIFRASLVGASAVDTLSNRRQLTYHQKCRVANGMLLDAVNIFVVVNQDPNSIESKEIRKVAKELEREAYQLEYLYKEIRFLN